MNSRIDKPRITAEVVFLTTEEGGRRTAPFFVGEIAIKSRYSPHIVIQSRQVRNSIVNEHHQGLETYSGIAFVSGPDEYKLGDSAEVILELMYHPHVCYNEVKPGATFTIREGGKIVGHGVVLTRVDPVIERFDKPKPESFVSEPTNRRPLKIREQAWVHSVTRWCLHQGFTPNSISLWSIAFSALAAGALFLTIWNTRTIDILLFLIVPIFLGLRGMCNLIDGLLAVEGGLKTKSGEVFNDVPDRISDSLIFVAAGYAAFVPSLGWAAALLAVSTAYVRMLGGALKAKQYFDGPMAKQTRMAVLSVTCLLTVLERYLTDWSVVMSIGLMVIIAGSAWTCARRLQKIVDELENS